MKWKSEYDPAVDSEVESPAALRFGAFELKLDGLELRRSGVRVKLQAQPGKVLALLASRSGQIVSRQEIQDSVWDAETHVDFDQGINACIKAVRTALGDRASAPRFVETVPRQGYRFVAPVDRIARTLARTTGRERLASPGFADDSVEDGSVEPLDRLDTTGESGSPGGPGRRLRRWTWPTLAAALALVVVVYAGVQWLATVGREPHAAPVRFGAGRLLVLPFTSLGAGEEYLGDALTAELITQLGQRYRDRLGVIARTSAMRYKDSDEDVVAIGRELGVEFVLAGTVRRGGERIRVTAELIRLPERTPIWADGFDRDRSEMLDVQSELAETISHALALELLPAQQPGRSADPDAYDAYLQGRYHLQRLDPDSASRAVAHLERAVAIDPGFAAAHAALARAHRRQPIAQEAGFQASRRAAQRALELDPKNAEAYLALAEVQFYHDWDLDAARRSFARAIELQPGYAEAHHSSAAYYSVTGKHEQAIAAVQRALALDPLSPSVNADVGWYDYFARRYDDAVVGARRTLEFSPTYYWAHRCILVALVQKGDLAAAARQAADELRSVSAPADVVRRVEAGDPASALRAYWEWDLERTAKYAARWPTAPSAFAMIHLALGDRDRALAAFEASAALRVGWLMPFLRVDPRVDTLRDDPRFQAILRELDRPRPSR